MASELSWHGTSTHRGRPGWRRALRTLVAMVVTVSVLAVPELAEASVSEVNQQRAAAGLAPVSEDPGLTRLAQQQAAQMAARSSLTHSGNLGAAVGSVAPGFSAAAENIGYGRSVSSVTNTFMTSAAHRSAILGNFNAAGVGVVVGRDGRVWVTQVFARVGAARAAAPAASRVSRPTRRVQTRRVQRRVQRSSSRRYLSRRLKCSYVRGRRQCRYVRVRSGQSVRRSARSVRRSTRSVRRSARSVHRHRR